MIRPLAAAFLATTLVAAAQTPTSTNLPSSLVKPLRLKLPTQNTALITGKPQDYYMYTTRFFEGVSSKPWTGGQWGYSRNLKRNAGEIIATRFHEGIDIKPMKRDSAGRPLDIVGSIADGKVVYCNDVSSRSNYGKYVVVEHNWGYGPFYSLYAHLASISCKPGQRVRVETPLGKMGYTGAGINRERAHLHLELNVLLHSEFHHWHGNHYRSPNHHGMFNGINMSGLNIPGLFIANHQNPNLSIPTFLQNTSTYYKVTVPRSGALEICQRYPWLCKGNHKTNSSSWEISFSDSAFPLAVVPSNRRVNRPTVTFVRQSKHPHSYRSRGMLTGSGARASLSAQGSRHIQLITGTFERKAPEAPIEE